MMSGKTHLIADESIGGVQREYVEVERKARVGDYVIVTKDDTRRFSSGEIVKPFEIDEIGIFIKHPRGGNRSNGGARLLHSEYKTLEPTDIVHIALDDSPGKRYHLVDRKADVGENVLIVDDECSTSHIGHYGTVVNAYSDGISINIGDHINYYPYAFTEDYRVLEPVADAISADEGPTVDARHASPEVIDLLANLARRVTSLESQLRDTQGNVEKLAEELEAVRYGNDELYGRLAHVEDERTQLQTVNITVNMPELPNDDVAKCVSEILKRLATNGSERP